jgi:hydroxylamine dehydrogenase
MKTIIKHAISFLILLFVFLYSPINISADEKKEEVSSTKLSTQTKACISCHKIYTPGIVKDWLSSRHSRTLPADALKKPALERRISADTVTDELGSYAVGCYECHSRNPERHQDNFQHMGYKINVVVTPNDCKTCHPREVEQFSDTKKYYAYKNIMKNPLYHTLITATVSVDEIENGNVISKQPSEETINETCLGCHGTSVKVKGMKKIYSKNGVIEIEVPDLLNWPNQGVGRENPDGSRGACSACHARHSFSIEMARKPYTCSQCHMEPDVPAWDVYKESKHGNIYLSKYHEWDFNSVPWILGKDFKAPTCAVCHNSLIVSPEGNVIAERSHNFGERLWVRIFGLIYSHPQPKSGDTTIIKNKDGLSLPTSFTGEVGNRYLIDSTEQERRLNMMEKICQGCHSTQWVNGHFAKFENTVKEVDKMTLSATNLLLEAWGKNIEDRTNPFDEDIERMWVRQWFFYSNSIRYASAMTGAPDYESFRLGWWELSDNLQKMHDLIDIKAKLKENR